MIDDLDDVLKQLLIRELPIKNGEVDISFDQPKREWSARISRPTLNLFLYDVRENQRLRQTQPPWETERNPDGTATQRRRPVRVDLHYMITAWATDPQDEHRLLSRALMALFRIAFVPDKLLEENHISQNHPIPIMSAQYTELNNTTDLWNVLDNELRPSIACILTVEMDPYVPEGVPLVRTRELRVGPSGFPFTMQLDEGTPAEVFYSVGGELHSLKPLDLENMNLILVEQGAGISLKPDGRFTIGRLRPGTYTLELTGKGRPAKRYPLTVPTADLILEV